MFFYNRKPLSDCAKNERKIDKTQSQSNCEESETSWSAIVIKVGTQVLLNYRENDYESIFLLFSRDIWFLKSRVERKSDFQRISLLSLVSMFLSFDNLCCRLCYLQTNRDFLVFFSCFRFKTKSRLIIAVDISSFPSQSFPREWNPIKHEHDGNLRKLTNWIHQVMDEKFLILLIVRELSSRMLRNNLI